MERLTLPVIVSYCIQPHMTEFYFARTRGGYRWIPRFIHAIRQKDCTACGKCYQVCAPGVLALEGLDRKGNRITDGSTPFRKVMGIQRGDLCRGCEACGMACPLDLFHFQEMSPVEMDMRAKGTAPEREQDGDPTGQNNSPVP